MRKLKPKHSKQVTKVWTGLTYNLPTKNLAEHLALFRASESGIFLPFAQTTKRMWLQSWKAVSETKFTSVGQRCNLGNLKQKAHFNKFCISTHEQFFQWHIGKNHSPNISRAPALRQLCTVHWESHGWKVTIPVFQEQTPGGAGICRAPAVGTSECLRAHILNGQMLHAH